jgi:hypothetical protein
VRIGTFLFLLHRQKILFILLKCKIKIIILIIEEKMIFFREKIHPLEKKQDSDQKATIIKKYSRLIGDSKIPHSTKKTN